MKCSRKTRQAIYA